MSRPRSILLALYWIPTMPLGVIFTVVICLLESLLHLLLHGECLIRGKYDNGESLISSVTEDVVIAYLTHTQRLDNSDQVGK
jgi:hypothetical protein